jgi:hypothetical protein
MLAMRRTGPLALGLALALSVSAGCKRHDRARSSSYTPPALPAGFVQQSGTGWHISVPATWKEMAQKGPAAWAANDPQVVDDFHANANVVTEPYTGESYDYAKANENDLRAKPRATVETVHEDVIDGDPTLVIETRWAPTPPSTSAYRVVQTALASHGTGYVVTCAVSASAFERYRSTCDTILRSFAVER